MEKYTKDEMQKVENHAAQVGWVAPLSVDDIEYFAYLRSIFHRYNITPSKATKLEYDFVTRVAESEFYLRKANA